MNNVGASLSTHPTHNALNTIISSEQMATLPAAVFSAKQHTKPVYIKCDQIQLKLRLLKLKMTKTYLLPKAF